MPLFITPSSLVRSSSQYHLIFLPALFCTLPRAHCQIEDSNRFYCSIANVCHFHRKTRQRYQNGDDVFVTMTHDLVAWALSPRQWTLPDNTIHWQETDTSWPQMGFETGITSSHKPTTSAQTYKDVTNIAFVFECISKMSIIRINYKHGLSVIQTFIFKKEGRQRHYISYTGWLGL